MSPARQRARSPGEAPQPFCEHCGTSVEAAKLGPWVGLGHCPSCDTYSCRWCWTEAAEACPECGALFGVVPVAALPATEAVVATSATTEALAAGTLAANALVAEKLAAEEAEGGAAARPLSGTVPAAMTTRGAKRVPVGIGAAVLAAAIFAVILGNPFGAGGGGGVLDATDRPAAASSSVDASEPTGTVDAGGTSFDPATSEPAAADSGRQPAGAPAPPSRPAATPTLAPGVTPAPTPRATATPPPTPHVTPPPTPTPTPAPTPPPTPAPTPTPSPACQTVPNMVGLTVAKARNAWNGAGFTGSFSAPTGPARAIVTSQSQPAGACLPPETGISVTT